jgi:hypothetical protein
MILKYFRQNILRKIGVSSLKLLLLFVQKSIITLVFEKHANFFAENGQKSQKNVIITSTPDEFAKKIVQNVAQFS